jgi:hypothetical protein
MTNEGQVDEKLELQKVEGALDLLFELREVFAQWVEEAQDNSKLETLENVLGHVEAVEREYKHRREEICTRLADD